jgi:hypothetical protein
MEMHLPKITIETLTQEDAEWYVEVATVRMLEEEVGRPELVHLPSLHTLCRMLIASGTGFIAKSDGVCIGIIGGLLSPNVFNPNITTLSELIWYVIPEYRNTRAGLLLLKQFIDKGDECADETTFCLLHTSQIKIATLEKRGFHLCEFAFRKQNR